MSTVPIHILVVTNNATLTPHLKNTVATLRNGRPVTWTAFSWDMLPLVLSSPATYPLILTDIRTDTGDNLSMLDSLPAAFPASSLLALVNNLEFAAEAVQLGASDVFTLADLTPANLERILRYAHSESQLRAELHLVKYELITSQTRLHSIFENAPIGISLVGLDGVTLLHNSGISHILDYPAGELDGVHYSELVHPDDMPIAVGNFETLLRTGIPSGIELRMQRKDGVYIWCRVHSSLIFDEPGVPTYVVGTLQDITAQKMAETLLQQSEAKFRTLTENTAAAILIHNGERFRYINEATATLSGYSVDEMMQLDPWSFIHPDHQSSVRLLWERRKRGEPTPNRYEFKARRRDQSDVWLDLTTGMMEFEGEMCLLATAFDITARKTAENALQDQLQLLQILIDTIPHPIYFRDAAGFYLGCNLAYIEVMGLRREQIIGKSLYEIFDDPLVAKRNHEADLAVIESNTTYHSETETRRFADNAIMNISLTKAPFYRAGEVSGVVCLVIDITEQKQIEAALRTSEQGYRLLAENATDLISRTSLEGKWQYISPASQHVLGYSPAELMGNFIIDYIHPDDVQVAWEANKALLATPNEPIIIAFRMRANGGEYRWIESNARAVVNPVSGQVEEFISVARDVTERKSADLELQQRARQQAVIARLGQRALQDRNLPQLLNLAVQFIQDALEVDYVVLLEQLPEEAAFITRAQVGLSADTLGKKREATSIAGFTLLTNEPIVVDNRHLETRFHYRAEADDYGITSSMTVIIPGAEQPFGVVGVHTKNPRKFTPNDINFLQTVANLLATAIDRLHVEQALMESRERFRLVSELSTDYSYCFRIEPNGEVICEWITEAYTRITGNSIDELMGRSTAGLYKNVHPDDLAIMMEATRPLGQNQKTGPYETRLYTKTGEIRWLQNSMTPIWDEENQRLAKVIGTASDITDRKRRERELEAIVKVALALRKAPTRASILAMTLNQLTDLLPFEGAALATLHTNGNGNRKIYIEAGLRRWKNSMGQHLAWGEGFIGRVIDEGKRQMIHDAGLHPEQFAYPELFADLGSVAGVPLVAEEQVIGAVVLGCKIALTDEDIHLLEVVSEVIANALYRASATEILEARVVERTLELQVANVQLQDANEQLKLFDQLKSKFVSDVSHELRTPVTNLGMHVYLLEHASPEKHQHYLAALREQVTRLTSLVENILQISRLEMGKTKVTFMPLDLNEIALQVVNAHQPRAELKGIRLEFLPGPNLPTFLGDYNQFSQVVTNLVANAVNYTSEGRIIVTFSSNLEERWVMLRVKDTGMGILPEDIPHLFERFYRGTLAGQSNLPGTGLGLSIVKEIVDLYDGQIEISSTVGEGTEFRVRLPLILMGPPDGPFGF